MKTTTLTGTAFLAKLITQYAHIHKKTVGNTADEYIRQLGLRTGEWIEPMYGIRDRRITPDEYADIIVDLKNSIGGHFYISDVFPDHVVVKSTSCPFGVAVMDAPHLCNMTSSVFGGIASRNFGYAKVSLRKRIALGDTGCEVAVYFVKDDREDGEVYEDLPITPVLGDPFEWEEETIRFLHEELRKSDTMITALLEELEALKKQVSQNK